MIASIGIPFLLLGISNGFAGWDTWLLADTKHFSLLIGCIIQTIMS